MGNVVVCRRSAFAELDAGRAVMDLLSRGERAGALSIIDPTQQGLADLGRVDLFAALTTLLGDLPRAIVGVPAQPVDLLVTRAAGAITGAPFGLWIVHDFGLGAPTAVPHLPEAFGAAAAVFASDSALRSAMQHEMQRRVYVAPPRLVPGGPDVDVLALVFDTVVGGGRLSDERLESSMIERDGPPSYYFDQPVPPINHPVFHQMFKFCDRLRQVGWSPDFVVDVGASTGIWSGLMSQAFPSARFVLCDPMFSRYPSVWLKPGMTKLEVAVSDQPGTARFQVSSDLYGSSLIMAANSTGTIDVQVVTLDQIIEQQGLSGRGLVKVDVQFAEHLVLEGAKRALTHHIDVIILELTLERVAPSARTLLEVAQQMDGLGFRILDVVGEWRDPRTGEAIQLDVAFGRRGMPGILGPCSALE